MSKSKVSRRLKIPDERLKGLLTPSEWRMLQNRYQIRNLLQEGLSIRKVAEKVGVGTDTVVRVARMHKESPSKKVLRSTTPWIFGKSE